MLVTVAETPEYLRCAERLLSATDRDAIMGFLAARPRFGKSERENLSKAERNDLAKLVAILKSTAGH
jgi:hypothetical protein